jgi:hypothetical protein
MTYFLVLSFNKLEIILVCEVVMQGLDLWHLEIIKGGDNCLADHVNQTFVSVV